MHAEALRMASKFYSIDAITDSNQQTNYHKSSYTGYLGLCAVVAIATLGLGLIPALGVAIYLTHQLAKRYQECKRLYEDAQELGTLNVRSVKSMKIEEAIGFGLSANRKTVASGGDKHQGLDKDHVYTEAEKRPITEADIYVWLNQPVLRDPQKYFGRHRWTFNQAETPISQDQVNRIAKELTIYDHCIPKVSKED